MPPSWRCWMQQGRQRPRRRARGREAEVRERGGSGGSREGEGRPGRGGVPATDPKRAGQPAGRPSRGAREEEGRGSPSRKQPRGGRREPHPPQPRTAHLPASPPRPAARPPGVRARARAAPLPGPLIHSLGPARRRRGGSGPGQRPGGAARSVPLSRTREPPRLWPPPPPSVPAPRALPVRNGGGRECWPGSHRRRCRRRSASAAAPPPREIERRAQR